MGWGGETGKAAPSGHGETRDRGVPTTEGMESVLWTVYETGELPLAGPFERLSRGWKL